MHGRPTTMGKIVKECQTIVFCSMLALFASMSRALDVDVDALCCL